MFILLENITCCGGQFWIAPRVVGADEDDLRRKAESGTLSGREWVEIQLAAKAHADRMMEQEPQGRC